MARRRLRKRCFHAAPVDVGSRTTQVREGAAIADGPRRGLPERIHGEHTLRLAFTCSTGIPNTALQKSDLMLEPSAPPVENAFAFRTGSRPLFCDQFRGHTILR